MNISGPFSMHTLHYWLLAILSGAIIFHFIQAWPLIIEPTNPDQLAIYYSQSQYTQGDAATRQMSDAELYEFAGTRYMAGEDPTTINFEHPPLGKYLLGLSWIIFGSSRVTIFGLYIVMLALLYVLGRQTLTTTWGPLVVVVGVSWLSVFPHYARQSMLDLPLLVTSLGLWVTLFSKKLKPWPQAVLAGVWIGLMAGIKYPFPSLGLVMVLVAMWLGWRRWQHVIVVGLVAVSVYLLSYSAYFIHHPSPFNFLRFEWYRFRWWTGNRTIPPFLIVQTLLRGYFLGWWKNAGYEVAPSWTPLWFAYFWGWLASVWYVPHSAKLKLLAIYAGGLFLLFAFGSASYERYLIQVLPFWILGVVYGLEYLHDYAAHPRLLHHQH